MSEKLEYHQLESPEIIGYFKQIVDRHFIFSNRQLDRIFKPQALIVTQIFLKFKDYFSFPKKNFLIYLSILEFIVLSLFQHEQIKFLKKNKPKTRSKLLIDHKFVRQILWGDFFIILAIQQINSLEPSKAKIFYEVIHDVYQLKIQSNLNQFESPLKKISFRLLEFILFLNLHLKQKMTQPIQHNTKVFYQNLVVLIQASQDKKSHLQDNLWKTYRDCQLNETEFPIQEFIDLLENKDNLSLIKPLV